MAAAAVAVAVTAVRNHFSIDYRRSAAGVFFFCVVSVSLLCHGKNIFRAHGLRYMAPICESLCFMKQRIFELQNKIGAAR